MTVDNGAVELRPYSNLHSVPIEARPQFKYI